jgi:hypothetical protein
MQRKHSKSGKPRKQRWTNLTNLPSRAGASVVRRLSYAPGAIAANGAGLTTVKISSATFIANAPEWASFVARYTEYRFLSIRIFPTEPPVSTLTTVSVSGIVCVGTDRSGQLGAPASQAVVWGLQSPKLLVYDSTQHNPPSYEARAIDLEDQNFQASSTAGSNLPAFAINFTHNGPVSANNIQYLAEAMVEFKGMQ